MTMDADHARPGPPAGGTARIPVVPPPIDLTGWLQGWHAAQASPSQPASRPATIAGFSPRGNEPAGRRQRRAAAYLATIPPAVSGQRGHDRTFHAACVLVKGFGLTLGEARPLLREWNDRCAPPWSAAELEHKLKSADAAPDDRPRGYLGSDRGQPCQEATTPRKAAIREAASAGPKAAGPEAADHRAADPPLALESPHCPLGQEANPHRLAGLFLNERFAFSGGMGLRFWRDIFYFWDGSAYRQVPAGEIRAQLSQSLAREFDRLYQCELGRWTRERDETPGPSGARRPPRPIPVTSRMVADVLQAIAGLVLIPAADCPDQPAWVQAFPDTSPPAAASPGAGAERGRRGATTLGPEDLFAPAPWPVDEILPARNALVHLPTFMDGGSCTVPPTPRFFNAFALDYDFIPTASEPAEWLDFLRQIWEDDQESIACLQEWFGYLLTPDTRQQKIAMMVGPKRSGRGTIARVLKALVGASNVANPTLATLARPFGLSVLIDKPVAVFPDARLSSRPDNAAIVECLLSISGEDDQTIDRKHLPAWTGRLPTRFVLISNELPRLRDASGALASRLIILRFTRSFYNREDTGLFDRLSRELPGILLWALAGWDRLRRRGRFVQPPSGRELLAAMEDLGSPISAFLRDRCVLDPREIVPVATLYDAWRGWCQEHGRDAVGDEPSFGRDLHAAIPGLSKSRLRQGPQRITHYRGIRLRTPLDPDQEPADQEAPTTAAASAEPPF